VRRGARDVKVDRHRQQVADAVVDFGTAAVQAARNGVNADGDHDLR